MEVTGSARPGYAWVPGCTCREVLIDWKARTVYHPFYDCPSHGQTTDLDIEDTPL